MPFDNMPSILKTDADLLRAAKARIDHPSKWCQNSFSSLRGDGMHICTLSALNIALGCEPGAVIVPALHSTRRRLAKRLVEAWGGTDWRANVFRSTDAEHGVCAMNNDVGHRELMAIFDKTIEKAEA
jgi:hypothetical protein